MPSARRLPLFAAFAIVVAVAGTARAGLGDGAFGHDKQPPTPPGNFQVSASADTSISTSWTASTDNVAVAGYALYRNGAKVGSTSQITFTFTGLTCHTSYQLAVAAFDKSGNYSTPTTLTTATTACQPPTDTTSPAISGAAKQGQTLASSAGSWNGTPTISYSYQWERCDSVGANCAVIQGATASSYALTISDVGSTVRSQVTATNPGGVGKASSPQTAVVQALSSGMSAYDQTILADHPVAYWAMNTPGAGSEQDLTGRGHMGSYLGGTPTLTSMMNGDQAVDFNGAGQYLTVPSSADFSIASTGQLTWEAWIRPDTLQWSSASDPSSSGYVNWIGKCQNYSPNCEWEGRMYASVNPENRCNRLSAYAFNPTAGYGSGAYWQPACGLLQAGQWLHVVGEYRTDSTPGSCDSAYPGTIDIWVNGVYWGASYHYPTGCMSQYSINPTAGSSPLNIATNALDSWFPGAIGKVAIYNYLLSQVQITAHFQAMAGAAPSGACNPTCTTPVPTQ